MSRSRREKTPDMRCGFEWEPLNPDTTLVACPHICTLPLDGHGDEHFCCRAADGTHEL